MEHPNVVFADEWRAARDELLVREKAHTHAGDRLAAERRRLPWMKVEKTYAFEGSSGKKSLTDLFGGRKQLIVYHHMLKPNDSSPCTGCGLVGDQMPRLEHLHARNTSLVFVSRAPVADIEAFKKRMEWRMPWVSTADSFNDDFDVPKYYGLNVFYRDDSGIYRTYFTKGRGVETLGMIWGLLDITPMGRQEEWEDSPGWVEQVPAHQWNRLHDEYGKR